MLISTVRSGTDQDGDYTRQLGFLVNPQRFNVSVTRARSLLIGESDLVAQPAPFFHFLCILVQWLATRIFWRETSAGAITSSSPLKGLPMSETISSLEPGGCGRSNKPKERGLEERSTMQNSGRFASAKLKSRNKEPRSLRRNVPRFYFGTTVRKNGKKETSPMPEETWCDLMTVGKIWQEK